MRILLGPQIGAGSYGAVFSVEGRPGVVAKRVQREDRTNEARHLQALRHPNLLRLLAQDATPEGDQLMLFKRYTWDLGRFLALNHARTSPAQRAHLVCQAAAAVQAVHDAGLVHRDVKPDNFFLDPDLGLVLGDFGLVCREARRKKSAPVYAAQFRAPEVDSGRYGAAADVFALACVVYEVLCNEELFGRVRDGDEWARKNRAAPPSPAFLARATKAQLAGWRRALGPARARPAARQLRRLFTHGAEMGAPLE